MTSAPVATTITLGTPPSAGPGGPAPSTSGAETDEHGDDDVTSPFEKILSNDQGSAQPSRSTRAAHPSRGTAAKAHGPLSGVPASSSEALAQRLPAADPEHEGPSASLVGAADGAGDADRSGRAGTLPADARDVAGTTTAGGAVPAEAAGAADAAETPDLARADGTTLPSASLTAATASTIGSTARSLDGAVPTTSSGSAPGSSAVPSLPAWRGTVATATVPLATKATERATPAGTVSSGSSSSSGPPPSSEGSSGSASPITAALRAEPLLPPLTGDSATKAVAGATGSERADATDLAGGSEASLDTAGLASSISGVFSRGSGSYNVVLNLDPPELGQVQARLVLRGDQLQVDLSPEHAAAHDALESALPALRAHLATGGLEVNVTVDERGAASQGAPTEGGTEQGAHQSEADGDESGASGPEATAAEAPTAGQTNHLHLVL